MRTPLAHRSILTLQLFACLVFPSLGQVTEAEEQEKTSRHRVSLTLGHTHIPAGEVNGEKKVLAVPSWGLDYNFQINSEWAVGLHSDIITETFTVLDFRGNNEFERERPLTMTVVGIFKPHERWSLLAGAGYEFAIEENLLLMRLGIERAWELEKDWEVFITAQYDLKFEIYDSWMLGVGFSKGF